MNKILGILCCSGFVGTLMLAPNSLSTAQNTVNNIFSPGSVVRIGPRTGENLDSPSNEGRRCNVPEGIKRNPVCAITRHRVAATYSSECFAKLDGAIKIYDHACPEMDCSAYYEPVCAREDLADQLEAERDASKVSVVKPYINECMATTTQETTRDNKPVKVKSAILRRYGDDIYFEPKQKNPRFSFDDFNRVCPRTEIRPNQDTCPNFTAYVCATDLNGNPRLYRNRCLAVFWGADPGDPKKPRNISECDRPLAKP